MHPNEILSGALAFLDAVPGGTFNYEMLRACKYRDGLIVALFAARPIRLANMDRDDHRPPIARRQRPLALPVHGR